MQEQMECTCGADVNGYAHTKGSGHAPTCPKHAKWTLVIKANRAKNKKQATVKRRQ